MVFDQLASVKALQQQSNRCLHAALFSSSEEQEGFHLHTVSIYVVLLLIGCDRCIGCDNICMVQNFSVLFQAGQQ